MVEKRQPGDAERLEVRAVLYAGGALTEAEAAAFEARLAEDQEAREALCRAAELLHGGAEGLRPRAAWRGRLRRRLGRSGLLAWLLRRRLYSGHPAVWTGLGAAAAVLVMVLFPWGGAAPAPASVSGPPAAGAHPEPQARAAAPRTGDRAAAEAAIWTRMPRSEHLVRAHAEAAQRKARAEKLQRLIQRDEGRARILGAASSKQ